MPDNRQHYGELLPNGFRVGDYVTYTRSDGRASNRYGYVTYDTSTDRVWATFTEAGEAEAMAAFERGAHGSYLRPAQRAELVRNYQGEATGAAPQEGSTTMTTPTEQGIWTPAPEEGVPNGARFRLFHLSGGQAPVRPDEFAYEGIMRNWAERNVTITANGTHTARRTLPADIDGYDLSMRHVSYAYWVPAEVPATPTDSAFDGQAGAFEPHNGQIPEPGTIVRGMSGGGSRRQIEGLFLRMNTADPAVAWVEAKRRRTRRADGTFTEWESYGARAERSVLVEGAEVFKPGAVGTAPKPGFARMMVISDIHVNDLVSVGMVLSAKEVGNADRIYRGKIVEKVDNDGYFTIEATHLHRATSATRYSAGGVYNWEELPTPENKRVIADWSEGRENWDRAGWTWEQLAPGQKPVDPALDPKRSTPYTGMKIGDLVVGLMRDGGRDTVSSWVRGTIVKWETRNWNPIIKVTDPMESDKKVGQEVPLYKEDTYPALADPKGADPEEFKKTLRAYLIGRHKRSDFCRGGLNTMLAAFGLPLYETRRRAQMVVTVDYDPNTTDLYSVQRTLQRGLPGVQGLSFTERSGVEIELTVESDRTNG